MESPPRCDAGAGATAGKSDGCTPPMETALAAHHRCDAGDGATAGNSAGATAGNNEMTLRQQFFLARGTQAELSSYASWLSAAVTEAPCFRCVRLPRLRKRSCAARNLWAIACAKLRNGLPSNASTDSHLLNWQGRRHQHRRRRLRRHRRHQHQHRRASPTPSPGG